jgi:hypothetical protein
MDTEKLLEAFLAFWKQHGEPLLKSAPYHEIAPHLVLMAFLHRVVNAGGSYLWPPSFALLWLLYRAILMSVKQRVFCWGCQEEISELGRQHTFTLTLV